MNLHSKHNKLELSLLSDQGNMHCGRKLFSTDKKAPSSNAILPDAKRGAHTHLNQVDKREKINAELDSRHDFLVNLFVFGKDTRCVNAGHFKWKLNR